MAAGVFGVTGAIGVIAMGTAAAIGVLNMGAAEVVSGVLWAQHMTDCRRRERHRK